MKGVKSGVLYVMLFKIFIMFVISMKMTLTSIWQADVSQPWHLTLWPWWPIQGSITCWTSHWRSLLLALLKVEDIFPVHNLNLYSLFWTARESRYFQNTEEPPISPQQQRPSHEDSQWHRLRCAQRECSECLYGRPPFGKKWRSLGRSRRGRGLSVPGLEGLSHSGAGHQPQEEGGKNYLDWCFAF